MKKLIILVSLFCFASCLPYRVIEREANLTILDLRKYSNNDFFISTYPYYGEYKPISIFKYEIKPRVVYDKDVITEEIVSFDVLIDSVYNVGSRIGANGAVEVKFSTSKDSHRTIYEVEGLFIKK